MKKAVKALKIRFTEPYKKNDNGLLKPNIPYLNYDKKQSGIYLIKSNISDKILYVGFSNSSLYKTIYRHFQEWKDISRTEQTRFTYNKTGYKVRVIFTTPARAELLEKYLILKINPRDNTHKYKNYLTESQETNANEIINDLPTYTGTEEDFPF